MPKTTEWERHVRRNEVIELRYGEGLTAREISNRLGWSQDTIERDLREISKETAVMGEPRVLREQIITSLMLLLDHDFEDLHRATTSNGSRLIHGPMIGPATTAPVDRFDGRDCGM